MKRCAVLLALCLSCVLLSACGGAKSGTQDSSQALAQPGSASGATAGKAAPANANDFLLGSGDTINIAVWRFDDLKRTIQIDPGGNIVFPLAGQVHAAGLTQDQLRQVLEQRLTQYYKDPVVDVSLATLRSASVHVLGEVKSPGSIILDKRMLIIEAISRSGGFTLEADAERVLLFRRDGDVTRAHVVSVSLKNIPEGATDYRMIQLSGDDIIYVPPSNLTDVYRFLNELVKVLDPFTSVGRSIFIGNQVYQIFRGQGNAAVSVSP
jgi:polysaccharide export outer membrane protein